MEWSQRADDHDSCKLPVLRSLPSQYKGLWAQMPVANADVKDVWPDDRLWFYDAGFFEQCRDVRGRIVEHREQGRGFDKEYNSLAGSQWTPDDRPVDGDREKYRRLVLKHAASISADVLFWDCGTGLERRKPDRNHVLLDDIDATLRAGMVATFYQHKTRSVSKHANHRWLELPKKLLRLSEIQTEQIISFEHDGTRIVAIATASQTAIIDEWMTAVRTSWFPLIRLERCRLCEATDAHVLTPE